MLKMRAFLFYIDLNYSLLRLQLLLSTVLVEAIAGWLPVILVRS